MEDMLAKLMMKKASKGKDDKMSDMEVQAKMEVLKELLGLAQDEMGGRVKSGMDEMQKVTVAAPDKESLLKGLAKAEEITEEAPEMDSDEESDEESENMSDGGIVNDKKTTMNDVMTDDAMHENFNKKADENPVDPDEEDSMFGTSLKKKKDAKKSSYASMMSDEE